MQAVKGKHVYMNSRNRASGTHSDFTYEIDFMGESSKYTNVVVLSATIPKSYYLIDDTNDTFTLNEDTGNKTITITHGNYDIDSFRTELTTKINNVVNSVLKLSIS